MGVVKLHRGGAGPGKEAQHRGSRFAIRLPEQLRQPRDVDGIAPPVVIDAVDFEPREAVAIDRRLPGHEFFSGEAVAIAGFIER